MSRIYRLLFISFLLLLSTQTVFAGRYYDSATGRWLSVDPKADKYPGWSPYNYCYNNPLRYIDPNGQEGWEVKNKWNNEYISSYRDFINHQIVNYSRNEMSFTCEDLSLSLLIDFSSSNNLPVVIGNGSGVLDVRSDRFNSIDDFKNAVLTSTGASDLQRGENTLALNTNDVQSGDLLLQRDNGTTANHVQVVRGTTNSTIEIAQGNSFIGSSNPTSFLYTGQKITFGTINKTTGNYNNYQTGKFRANFLKKYNVEAREWNFINWNE
jgi:hypothetical protein